MRSFPPDTQSHWEYLCILTVVSKAVEDVSTEERVTASYSKTSAE